MGRAVQAQTEAPKPPAVRAAAAIVLEAKTGRVLFAKNPDRRLPPASTTKIMTAWLFARDTQMEKRVTTPPEAAKVSGSVLGMAPGETFTARDLLYAMLLLSANDACIAAAKQNAGSVPAFVARMNQEAQQLGLPNTHFVNTNGLPAPNHYASARDLALLARQALGNPPFAEAARTKTYSVPRANQRPPTELVNRNELLWTVPGMDGVKTGQTQEAGFCFVGSVTRQGRRIITVVLNSPDWKKETAALVNYSFKLPVAPSPNGQPGAEGHGLVSQSPVNRATPDFLSPSGKESGSNTSPVNGASKEPAHALQRRATSVLPPITQGAASSAFTGQERFATSPPTPFSGSPLRGGRGETNTRRYGLPSPSEPERASRRGAGGEAAFGEEHADGNRGRGENQIGNGTVVAGRDTYTPRGSEIKEKQGKSGASREANKQGLNRQPGQGIGGRATYAWPRFTSQKPAPPSSTFWWLLLWLLLLPLIGWLLLWLARKGNFAMKPGLLWPFARRRNRNEETPSAPVEDGPTRRRIPVKAEKTTPPFAFLPPQLSRLSVGDWLSALLENTPRLLEAATRRQARDVIAANPLLNLEKAFALLGASKAKTRLHGAEILREAAPRRAEETLIGIIEDEKTPADVRAEATDLLAEENDDRHEPFFLRMMLRDGSSAAACALARLPRLDATTTAALRHVATEGRAEREADSDLRGRLLAAQAACVLGAQGLMRQEEVKPVLDRLPANHREQTLTGTLRGVTSPWAIERMVGIALRGQATYPALQNLLECDPEAVRATFDTLPELDSAARTRAMVLRRLLLGEGETEPIKKLAEAGDNLANSALQLERLQRWHPSQAAPEALLAAAMLTSLRLGFTTYSPEQIASVFRTVGEEGQDALADAPELAVLRQAYGHPDVYDAVQAALATEDGTRLLVTSLLPATENPSMQEELAFWSDKLATEARLPITQALASCDSESARAALSARASDPHPAVRSAALRALHAYARATSTQPAETHSEDIPAEPVVLDKAA